MGPPNLTNTGEDMITLEYLTNFERKNLLPPESVSPWLYYYFKDDVIDEFLKIEEVSSTYQELLEFFDNFALSVFDVYRNNAQEFISSHNIPSCYIHYAYEVSFFSKRYELKEPIPVPFRNPIKSAQLIPVAKLALPQPIKDKISKDNSLLDFGVTFETSNSLRQSHGDINFGCFSGASVASGAATSLYDFCHMFSRYWKFSLCKDIKEAVKYPQSTFSSSIYLLSNIRLEKLLFTLSKELYDKKISNLRSLLNSLSQYTSPQDLFSLML